MQNKSHFVFIFVLWRFRTSVRVRTNTVFFLTLVWRVRNPVWIASFQHCSQNCSYRNKNNWLANISSNSTAQQQYRRCHEHKHQAKMLSILCMSEMTLFIRSIEHNIYLILFKINIGKSQMNDIVHISKLTLKMVLFRLQGDAWILFNLPITIEDS